MYQEELVDTRHILSKYNPEDILSKKEMDFYDSLSKVCVRRRLEWLGGRIALKKILGDLTANDYLGSHEILSNTNGAPYVKGPLNVSISHQDGQAIGVVSKFPIGTDLTQRKTVKGNVQKYYMSNRECSDVNRFGKNEYVSLVWSIKEAYLKAIGTGLTRSPKSIEVLFRKNGNEFPEALIYKEGKHLENTLVFYRKYKTFFLSTVIVRS